MLAVAPDLLCWLPVSERAKMRPVYSLIVKYVLMIFMILADV